MFDRLKLEVTLLAGNIYKVGLKTSRIGFARVKPHTRTSLLMLKRNSLNDPDTKLFLAWSYIINLSYQLLDLLSREWALVHELLTTM
jgi:hypothetical protein